MRLAAAMAARLPPWLILAVTWVMAWPLSWLPLGRLQVARRNIALACPQLGSRQRHRLLRHCLTHWLATALEILQAGSPHLNAAQLLQRMSLDGLEHLDQALRQGRGVILLSAHLGNFTWFVLRLAAQGYPVTVFYKEQSALPAHFFRRIMERFGVEGLAVQEGRHQAARQALRALRHGRVLFIHMDQGRRHGETVRFLGQMIQLPAGPAVLATASGAPCLPAFTWRMEQRHTALIHAPLTLAQERTPQALHANLQTMTNALEQAIMAHPAQWLWMHRLFKWSTPCGIGEQAPMSGLP
jgi:KDO2-lipid IV(A) lauroyltransferase